MPRPRLRLTVRWLMALVLVAGLATRAAQVGVRWHAYRQRAGHHAAEAARLDAELSTALTFRREHGHFPGCGLLQGLLEEMHAEAIWHARLTRKYARAAARPWLRVSPDPPRPE